MAKGCDLVQHLFQALYLNSPSFLLLEDSLKVVTMTRIGCHLKSSNNLKQYSALQVSCPVDKVNGQCMAVSV